MPDIENFDDLLAVAVHHNVRRDDKLASAFDLSQSARAGKRGELLDAVDNRLSDFPGGVGIILLNVVNSRFKLVGGFGCSPDTPHRSNNRLMRFTTSSWSISSPRSAAAIPFSTPATKRA